MWRSKGFSASREDQMGHARGNRGACAEDGADVGEKAVLDPSAVRMDFQKCLISFHQEVCPDLSHTHHNETELEVWWDG